MQRAIGGASEVAGHSLEDHFLNLGLNVWPAPKSGGKFSAQPCSQRGKPRSREPGKNPLGTRIFDMGCCWSMYRVPYGPSFRYLCGLYQQSSGAKCEHNMVDGPTATRFLLGCIQQRILSPRLMQKIEQRLVAIAEREVKREEPDTGLQAKKSALAQVNMKLDKGAENLLLAENETQRQAMAKVFEKLQREKLSLEAEIAAATKSETKTDLQAEVAAALNLAKRLGKFSDPPENLPAVGQLFQQVNARMFFRFRKEVVNKRTLNRVASGVVTFGSAPPPIVIYEGPTARKKIQGSATMVAAEPGESGSPLVPKPSGPGKEGESLGNVSRGDWIRTSDLLNPMQFTTLLKRLKIQGRPTVTSRFALLFAPVREKQRTAPSSTRSPPN
jgi:hypothetical protein